MEIDELYEVIKIVAEAKQKVIEVVTEIKEKEIIIEKVTIKKRKRGIETVVKDLKRSLNILNKIEFSDTDKFEKMLIRKMCNESIEKLKKLKSELMN